MLVNIISRVTLATVLFGLEGCDNSEKLLNWYRVKIIKTIATLS